MEAPRPIPGTSKAGEPAYRKPNLPAKAELLAYYYRIAPLLLKHAARRPLNLFRCTAGHCFFQRNRNHPDSDRSALFTLADADLLLGRAKRAELRQWGKARQHLPKLA